MEKKNIVFRITALPLDCSHDESFRYGHPEKKVFNGDFLVHEKKAQTNGDIIKPTR